MRFKSSQRSCAHNAIRLSIVLLAGLTLACGLLPATSPTATVAPPSATPTLAQPATQTATVTLTPEGSAPTEETAPLATPTPTVPPAPATPTTPLAERISMQPGSTYFDLTSRLEAGEIRRYVMGVAAGQYLELSVTPELGDDVSFSLTGASDGAVVRADGDPFFKGTVPSSQDYLLTITNRGPAVNFGLSLMIPIRISFDPGATTALRSAIQAPDTLRAYVIRALGGQTMTARANAIQGGVILLVLGADGTVLQSAAPASPTFSSNLNTTQDYLILVKSDPGAEARYTLEVSIPPLGVTPTPEASAPTRISFSPGATSASVSAALPAEGDITYVLAAAADQLMELSVSPNSGVAMRIVGADGQVLMPEGGAFYRGLLPRTQDYFVHLCCGSQAVNATLTVIIPRRVTFAPGGITAEIPARLAPATTGNYVIRALGGQTMTVEAVTTQGQVILIVYGADGTVLQTDHSGSSTFSGVLPTSQDYLIDVRSVGPVEAVLTLRFTIPPP